MPNAATLAFAYQDAQDRARGFGMPGIREGMWLGRQAKALGELVARDAEKHVQESERETR